MNKRSIAAVAMVTLFLAFAASGQSAADLLQKGIHAQETVGDLDGAIQIFRQVVASPNTAKPLAAQAQYQLVLCMLQKGDRSGAGHELELLEKNFSDQPDLVAKARKLIPDANTLLPAPWLDGEASQLNIKRDGAFTGEYLYYSVDPWRNTVPDYQRNEQYSQHEPAGTLQSVFLRWELVTRDSTRSITVRADPDTLRPLEKPRQWGGSIVNLESDDLAGDATVSPFVGPAIDTEQTVFLLRRLPLAPGYKTTLPVTMYPGLPPRQLELAVTAIEPVEAPAGKYNCYKVSFASLGQTFWIAVEGNRPLVKFQAADVEADLVKVWGSENPINSALAFLTGAGWFVDDLRMGPGPDCTATVKSEKEEPGRSAQYHVSVLLRKIHTPPAQLAEKLQQIPAEETKWMTSGNAPVVASHIQAIPVGGHPSIRFPIERMGMYEVWVLTESYSLRLRYERNGNSVSVPVFRWLFDPILATAKIP